MPFDDLTKFLQAAADAGELERITIPLQVDQEISALTHQICREFRSTSPVLLFENPVGHSIPVVTNLLGNRARFLRALGVDHFEEVTERLRAALSPFPAGRNWKFGFGSVATPDRARFSPRILRRGMAQQVVKLGKELDLRQLPALRCWPGESGRLLTSAQIISESSHGVSTLEQCPVEIIDGQTLQLHWGDHHILRRLWEERLQEQRQLPLVISLGGDPLLSYAASLPVPNWLDPWMFVGLLRNESLNLVRARTVELNVPADAEILIEGYLETTAPQGRGTAAGVAGTLETRSQLPLMNVTAVTHRANPLFPAQVQALDISEEVSCSQLTELLLLKVLQLTQSTILDLHLPAWGGHRRCVVVATSARTADEVQTLLHAVSSMPVGVQAGMLIAVGPEVDIRDQESVWREVSLAQQRAPWTGSATPGSPRIMINATGSHQHAYSTERCLPSSEVLAALARQVGNSSLNSSENTVPNSPEINDLR